MQLTLRDYQRKANDSIFRCLLNVRSVLVEMATGLGKTVLFAELASKWGGGVLVLVHRRELLQQAAEKLLWACGEEPHIEMAQQRADIGAAWRSHVVVASVQSISQPKRLARFSPNAFGLIIIDECHHATPGSQYSKVLDYFKSAKVVGVTATPKRHDNIAMGNLFEAVAFRYGIEEAIDDGYLVPIRQEVVYCEGLDFSGVRSIAGDLSESDLERLMVEEKVIHQIAAPANELTGDRKSLFFCVTVNHANLLHAALNNYQPGTTRFLSGESKREERDDVLKLYRSGEVNRLCNCALFLEGFDAPATEFVVMARPTKSLPLYTQVIGRGTRPLPGVVDGLTTAAERKAAIANSRKPHMTVLDFAGNAGRHKLIRVVDLLGGRYTDEEINDAREMDDADAAENLKAARAIREINEVMTGEVERMLDEIDEVADPIAGSAAVRDWKQRITARASYRTNHVNLFGGASHATPTNQVHRDGATERQVNYLCYLGVERRIAERYSRAQAGAVISSMKKKKALA